MREIQVCSPTKGGFAVDRVRRLGFRANGAELVAWVGSEVMTKDGRTGFTNALHTFDLARGVAEEVYGGDSWFNWYEERTPDPTMSPDGRLLVFEHTAEGGYEENGFVYFEHLDGDPEARPLPKLRGCSGGACFAFTPDAATLLAVRHEYKPAGFAVDVARLVTADLFKPPVRTEEFVNPLNNKTYKVPVFNVRWRRVLALPPGDRYTAVAVSANSRFLGVGGGFGGLHVADLKKKKVVASFPWEGRKLRDRSAVRVAFSPDAKWVVMLANGRLFARPLGEGKAWQTKDALGYAHDFAFHPAGRTLCAVFADGQARYLDALSGAVRQSFRWSKKPQPLYSVCFAPDGLTCAAGSEKGKVVVWDVDG